MIAKNSGKIYRFKLEHNLGFGFAEVYDFTDELSMLDGRLAYVYCKIDKEVKPNYDLSEIRKTGLALGPIRLYKFPATRGLYSWKYLFQTDDLLITSIPETKELHELHTKDNNWNNFKTWYKSNSYFKKPLVYIAYKEIRNLETRIINSSLGVVKEFTMKTILDKKEKVSDYYDLSQVGNKNLFVYLINTYYPLSKTKEYLKQIPSQ